MAGRAGNLADGVEAGAKHGIGRQSEIDDIEDVEELGAKLQHAPFRIAAPAERSVLDQSEVQLVESWPAKAISSDRAEVTFIWPGAAGKIDGNREE